MIEKWKYYKGNSQVGKLHTLRTKPKNTRFAHVCIFFVIVSSPHSFRSLYFQIIQSINISILNLLLNSNYYRNLFFEAPEENWLDGFVAQKIIYVHGSLITRTAAALNIQECFTRALNSGYFLACICLPHTLITLLC